MWGHVLPVGLVALFAAFNQDGCGISSGNREGRASFAITDAPVDDVDQVRITVNRIVLGYDDRTVSLPINPPVVIDNLLDFQGTTKKQLLPLAEIRAGDYDWVRIYINERNDGASVRERVTGQQFPLQLEDTAATGTQVRYLQLDHAFRIPRDKDSNFTLELDLRKALIKRSSDYYLLRPTLRLAREEDSATITGTVAAPLVSAIGCTSDNAADEGRGLGNAVYLYQGTGMNMGDIYTRLSGAAIGSRNPYAIAPVRKAIDDDEYRYEFGYLPAGSYTLGFTCQAVSDRPLAQDNLRFDTRHEVTVKAGEPLDLALF